MIKFTTAKHATFEGRKVLYKDTICIVDKVGLFHFHLRDAKCSRHGTRTFLLTVAEAEDTLKIV
jgi:hypothetical protein